MIVLHSGVLRAATLALVCGAALGSRADEPSPQLKALLARLPAETPEVRTDLLALAPADIRALCGMLVEPGTADDNPARLALHGLALALGDPGQAARRATFVQTLGEVLNGESPPHDGPFVIEQMQLGGGRSAVNALGRTLTHERWCADAARGLAAVGGEQALQVLHAALPTVGADCRPAVIAALGELGDPASVTELLKDARSPDPAVGPLARPPPPPPRAPRDCVFSLRDSRNILRVKKYRPASVRRCRPVPPERTGMR
jgi:hypothetical protein